MIAPCVKLYYLFELLSLIVVAKLKLSRECLAERIGCSASHLIRARQFRWHSPKTRLIPSRFKVQWFLVISFLLELCVIFIFVSSHLPSNVCALDVWVCACTFVCDCHWRKTVGYVLNNNTYHRIYARRRTFLKLSHAWMFGVASVVGCSALAGPKSQIETFPFLPFASLLRCAIAINGDPFRCFHFVISNCESRVMEWKAALKCGFSLFWLFKSARKRLVHGRIELSWNSGAVWGIKDGTCICFCH